MKGGFYNPPNGDICVVVGNDDLTSMKGGFYNPPNYYFLLSITAAITLQ